MRRTLHLAACFVVGLTVLAPAADAVVKPGACTIDLTMSFTSQAVTIWTTADVSIGLSGGGDTCAPVPSTSVPEGLMTTMNVTSAIGVGKVIGCSSVAVAGTSYGITFGQHFGPSNGSWVYTGSVVGGVLLLVDTDSPALIGVAELALDPQQSSNTTQLQACLLGDGMTQLRFTGVLTFVA